MEEVWAIVKMDYGVDGRGKPSPIVKRIFTLKSEAEAAVFKPYTIIAIQIDPMAELEEVERKLTVKQRYIISRYNEKGLKEHLKL